MALDNPTEAEEAASLLALARQTHEAHVQAAKVKAAEILENAEAEATQLLVTAHAEHSSLQARILELREFEENYRGALRNYLTELIGELNMEDDFLAPNAVEEIAGEETEEEEIPEEAPVEEEIAPETPAVSPEEEIADEKETEGTETENSDEEFTEAVTEFDNIFGDAVEVPKSNEFTIPFEDANLGNFSFGEEEDDDPSDDLPPVPDSLDPMGTHTGQIAILDVEIAAGEEDTKDNVLPPDTVTFDLPAPVPASAARAFGEGEAVIGEGKKKKGFFS